MNLNKVLVNVYVPKIDQNYNVWIPINKKIGKVTQLLVKAINEMNMNYYNLEHTFELYDKSTGKKYSQNQTVKEAGIRNGTELIVI